MAFPRQYVGNPIVLRSSPNGSIFLGADNGLMRSTDNGDTWAEIVHGQRCDVIGIDGSGRVFAQINTYLVRSTDNGDSWQPIGPAGWRWSITDIVFNKADDVFAGVNTIGVYRSTDHGDSWASMSGNLPSQPSIVELAVSPVGQVQPLYVNVRIENPLESALYRSTDNGLSWVPVLVQSSIEKLGVHTNGFVFCTVSTSTMRSTDNGTSWQVVSGEYLVQGFLSLSNGHIWRGYNYSRVWTGCPLVRSTDNGATWEKFDSLMVHAIYVLTQAPNGAILIATDRNGVFRTTDQGISWHDANTGLPDRASHLTAFAEKPGGTVVAGTSDLGTYRSTDFGATWVRTYPGYWYTRGLVAHPGGLIFAGETYLGISADNGDHWDLPIGQFAADIALGQDGSLYRGEAFAVERSTNLGATWSTLSEPGGVVYRIHVARDGTIIIYTLKASYIIERYTRTSTDNGQTWATSVLGSMSNEARGYTSCTNGYLFAASPAGVFRSTNRGQTWAPMSAGITRTDIRSIAVNSRDVLFVGTAGGGVFRSEDYGLTWSPFNEGLADSTVTGLYCNQEGYLYAGGWTGGVFKTVQSTTSVNDGTVAPSNFALWQNFPNPFNPSTIIRYGLPHRAHVTLNLYNTLGQLLSTLVQAEGEAGYHEVKFDAGGLSSGVYFYRMQAGVYSATKKLLLLK